MSVNQLGDALGGQTLFGGGEAVVIRRSSKNRSLWDALADWAEKLDDETTLILLETKPDKRTKTYKALQTHAKLVNCEAWSSRQTAQAESWLRDYAVKLGISLDTAITRSMVQRAIRPSEIDEKPIIDQQLLATAVKQLSLADTVDEAVLDTVMPPSLSENVFSLLERAIQGDIPTVQRMVSHLSSAQQDGHQTFGLLASQASNLAALTMSSQSPEQIAMDIGANPYALRQLAPIARQCSRERISAGRALARTSGRAAKIQPRRAVGAYRKSLSRNRSQKITPASVSGGYFLCYVTTISLVSFSLQPAF